MRPTMRPQIAVEDCLNDESRRNLCDIPLVKSFEYSSASSNIKGQTRIVLSVVRESSWRSSVSSGGTSSSSITERSPKWSPVKSKNISYVMR